MTQDGPLTWRDLQDELTAEQIANLAERENRHLFPPGLVAAARVMARRNVLQALHADIPPPPDAVTLNEWESSGSTQRPAEPASRVFTMGFRREDGDLSVELLGIQYSDGRVERTVLTQPAGEQLTGEQARRYAALLLAAADELDGHPFTQA